MSLPPNGPEDPHAQDAGAYVLGALAPAERDAFERHLPGCGPCRAAVEDLAGLPGLLGRLPAEARAALEEDARTGGDALRGVVDDRLGAPGVPDTVLAGLLRSVRRRRRGRRLALAGGLAAAAALAAVVLPGAVRGPEGAGAGLAAPAVTSTTTSTDPATPPSAAPAAGRPFEAIVPVPLSATARLTPVDWGTQVDLTCAYTVQRAVGQAADAGLPYALVVLSRDGTPEQIGTWTARPGLDTRLSGVTALRRDEIAGVQVRTLDGTPLMRLVDV